MPNSPAPEVEVRLATARQVADDLERRSPIQSRWMRGLADELETALTALAAATREAETLREAGAKVCEAFDRQIFVRNIEHDGDPAWAVKLLPYVQALAALAPRSPEGPPARLDREGT